MTSNTITTKTMSKGERRRVEIIKLARQVLTTEGYEVFALRNIASRADMKLGNLQYYFPSKESLLEAVIRAEAEDDLSFLINAVEKQTSPRAQIASFCESIITRWRGESGRVFALMAFLANESPVFSEMYKTVYQNFYDALIPILKSLRPEDAQTQYLRRAMIITALIDGAPGQVTRGNSKSFISDISNQAILIALGE